MLCVPLQVLIVYWYSARGQVLTEYTDQEQDLELEDLCSLYVFMTPHEGMQYNEQYELWYCESL